jgi:alkyl hydroperoxide reductase subunit D
MIEELKDRLGDYAKDVKLNIGTVLTTDGAPELSQNQIYGVALASAYATRNAAVVAAVAAEVDAVLSAQEKQAAKAAATIMAMNNVYYRFTHLVSDTEFATLPARLRMNVIGNPGIPKVDFELYSLAVSAINGCGMCMDAHVHEVRKGDVSALGIQSAIRIAAVVGAVAQAEVIATLM